MAYHSQTVPKGQKPPPEPLIIYPTADFYKQVNGFVQFVSIDPAKKTMVFRCQRDFMDVTFPMCFDLKDFSPDCQTLGKGTIQSTVYQNILNYLDSRSELFSHTHVFVIEKQPEINYLTVRISQLLITYFLVKYSGSGALVVEIDARKKGSFLKVANKFSKPELKKFTLEWCYKHLREKNDQASIEVLDRTKPSLRNNLSDTVAQLEAYKQECPFVPNMTYDQWVDRENSKKVVFRIKEKGDENPRKVLFKVKK